MSRNRYYPAGWDAARAVRMAMEIEDRANEGRVEHRGMPVCCMVENSIGGQYDIVTDAPREIVKRVLANNNLTYLYPVAAK